MFDPRGNAVATLVGHSGGTTSAHFVDEAGAVVTIGSEGTVRWWDLDDEELIERSLWRPRVVQHGDDGSVLMLNGGHVSLRDAAGNTNDLSAVASATTATETGRLADMIFSSDFE